MSRGHVVLVGAGHANLGVVRQAVALRRAGLAVTLVDPDVFWYSGMAAATAGGVVSTWRDRVDPAALAARRGVAHVRDRVVGLDPDRLRVELAHGPPLQATAVVLNVGSEVDPRGLPVGRADVTPAKPTTGLLALRERLAAAAPVPQVVVVGGGASAVELAANLAGAPGDPTAPHVTVVAPGPPVAALAPSARARLLGSLRGRGVRLELGVRATDVTDAGVVLDDARVLRADQVVLATGLRASPLVARLGLGDADGMPVTATLQHPDHAGVLGAGDAVRFGAEGLPRLGVFAVRQTPVLLHNLVALHTGRQLRRFDPQTTWTAAIDLGGGAALLLLPGGHAIGGRTGLVGKRVLDEWFLRRHRH